MYSLSFFLALSAFCAVFLGSYGSNAFFSVKELEYLNMNDTVRLCLMHGICFGIAKDLIQLFFGSKDSYKKNDHYSDYKLSEASKSIVFGREHHIILTGDFNRAYRSIVTCKGKSWTMEDFSRFIEVFSVYLFSRNGLKQVLPEKAIQLWGYLRRFFMLLFRSNGLNYETSVTEAHSELLQYAKFAEEVKITCF